MLTQKGEFSGGMHANFKGVFTVQGAYAVSDHIGLIGTGSSLHSNKTKLFTEQDFGELGAGYFTRFGANQSRILEVYAGAGFGHANRTERTREGVTTLNLDTNLEKYFLQVNYTKKKREEYEVLGRKWQVRYGAAMRLSYLNMNDFRVNNVLTKGEDNIFFEPVSYFRVGLFGPVKFQYMSGWNFRLKNRKYLTAANSVASFGIIVNIGGDGKRDD